VKRSAVDEFKGKRVVVETESGDFVEGVLQQLERGVTDGSRKRRIAADYEVFYGSTRTKLFAAEIIGIRRIDV
jgi:hypothetical protein